MGHLDFSTGTFNLGIISLLILADSIANLSLVIKLSSEQKAQPGYWNFYTLSLLTSGIADIVGQVILGHLADRKSHRIAIFLNAGSISLASGFAFFSLWLPGKWSNWGAALSPLFSLLGGGSHATAFLALVLLHNQTSVNRATFYYFSGAITVISQSIALYITPWLAERKPATAFALPIIICLLAVLATGVRDVLQWSPSTADEQRSLLFRPGNLSPKSSTASLTDHFPNTPSATSSASDSSLRLVALALSLAGISKATRPLFKTFIQHRISLTISEASKLWAIRLTMCILILGVLLPFSLRTLDPSAPSSSFQPFALRAAQISIILMGTGALMIGLADNMVTLLFALITNTLGCAMDLSLLSFYADRFPTDVAGRAIMTVASLESLGTLLGIGTLYPAYQWGLGFVESLGGGLAYYLCAGIYSVVAVVITRIASTVGNEGSSLMSDE